MSNFPKVILGRVAFKFNVLRCGAPLLVPAPKVFLDRPASTTVPAIIRGNTFLRRLADRFSFFSVSKFRLKANGYTLFESIADRLDYAKIFKTLNLPDTFYSWFVITELHVWMLMVRYMAEGENGKVVRNSMVQALWDDVNERTKKLTPNMVGIKKEISHLSDQMNAAIIAYDEGLQSNDVILAGALWRRLYQQKGVDPEHLDILVKYIRRQMKMLDYLGHKELFYSISIKWEPIKL